MESEGSWSAREGESGGEECPTGEEEVCREFFEKGCCMQGARCGLSHGGGEELPRRRGLGARILNSFPELVGLGSMRRAASFLS